MNKIPVIGFAGYSGSGKTTLIEKLVRILKEKGLRIAVVKHDGHTYEIDREGTDSWRFAKAGAEVTILSSIEKTVCIEQRSLSLEDVLGKVKNADLILVEGYKREALPQIGICRSENGKGFPDEVNRYLALVTDREMETELPCFHPDEAEAVAEWILTWMQMGSAGEFTHFNEEGRARMVDVGEKPISARKAVAAGRVLVNRETFSLIQSGGMKKGDVLSVAQIAGIMGAKRTSDLIPMCHPILIEGIDLSLWLDETRCSVEITASVSCDGRTGVEMEALTAVSSAALTVYDMCKAVQKDMVISDIRLLRKTGGVHGDFEREEER